MTLYDYKRQAMNTARYKDSETQRTCAALGLCGEAGEVAEKVKKHYRDGTELDGEAVAKDMGTLVGVAADVGTLECHLGNHRDGATGSEADMGRQRAQKQPAAR